MQTRSVETGERIPFRMREGDHLPHVLAEKSDEVDLSTRGFRTARVDPTQHQRTDKPGKYVMNAEDAILRYVDDFSRDMAASHYFGPRTEGTRWGENADAIWKTLVAENKPMSAAAFESRMDKLMNPTKLTTGEKVANSVAAATAKMALPLAPLTSWAQAGTNVARNGVSNTVEGMTRWLRDPSMKKLAESSGALNAGITEMATEAGVNPRTLGSKWMGSTERGLRGFLNSGTVPYAEQLVAKVQAGDRSRVTLRKLRELGVELAEAEKGMTADLQRRIMQQSSDTLQLQAHDPVNAGQFFDSPYTKAGAQFMQYPAEAARLFHDMSVDPVVQGVRNLDPAEVGLGLGRTARWIGGTAAGAGAAELARSALTGREPDPMNVAYNTADSIGGLPSTIATTLARGFDPTKGALQPPLLGIVRQSGQSAGRVLSGSDPERGLTELIADAVAAYDPTGTGALLRQPVRGYLRENQ
jgi:hypothetical protein